MSDVPPPRRISEVYEIDLTGYVIQWRDNGPVLQWLEHGIRIGDPDVELAGFHGRNAPECVTVAKYAKFLRGSLNTELELEQTIKRPDSCEASIYIHARHIY